MLRDLLVYIPSERPLRPVVDAAVSLAVEHAAHLDAVSIGFEYTNVDLAPDGGAALAALIEIEQGRQEWCHGKILLVRDRRRDKFLPIELHPLRFQFAPAGFPRVPAPPVFFGIKQTDDQDQEAGD